MADTMETVTRGKASAGTTESVGPFTLTVASSELSPDAEQRWTMRAEMLANWLIAEWRREQEQAEGSVIGVQRLPDEDRAVRRCDLN